MGGAGHKMAHNVFIWDRDSGVLVKVLEGPKESLVDCDVSWVFNLMKNLGCVVSLPELTVWSVVASNSSDHRNGSDVR